MNGNFVVVVSMLIGCHFQLQLTTILVFGQLPTSAQKNISKSAFFAAKRYGSSKEFLSIFDKQLNKTIKITSDDCSCSIFTYELCSVLNSAIEMRAHSWHLIRGTAANRNSGKRNNNFLCVIIIDDMTSHLIVFAQG